MKKRSCNIVHTDWEFKFRQQKTLIVLLPELSEPKDVVLQIAS